jgi:adenosylmethionine-8-amino-7-oxononanoate aminotransferase
MAGSHVFYRSLAKRQYPVAVRGSGCWIEDADGRRYLDGSGGAFVVNVGHGVREIADAMAAQAGELAYVNGTVFTTEPVEALADAIAARSPGDLDRVYFLMSGSEAVEAALKLARQYWVESGRPSKRTILALSPSYHGNTLLALSVSKRGHYQSMFQDWLVPVPRVPAPYSYRCACQGVGTPCPACDGTAVEAAILASGPENVAAFIAEPIGGSSTGASVPRAEYWRTVRAICDRYEVLLIADEILTGVGRTGTWSAIASYGVVPDLMTFGKGIAGGAAPLSALVAPSRIVDVLARGSGSLMHAQTFSHHAVSCAAGLATIEYLDAHDLIGHGDRVGHSASMGLVLHNRLEEIRGLPHVGDVRGRGLLAGIEFVEDVDTRRPFPREKKFAERFVDAAFAAGLIVWPQVGSAEGGNGDFILLAPPYVITETEIGQLVDRFRCALEAIS